MLGHYTVTHNDWCYYGSKQQVGRSGSVPQGQPQARLFKVNYFTHSSIVDVGADFRKNFWITQTLKNVKNTSAFEKKTKTQTTKLLRKLPSMTIHKTL